MKKHVHRQNRKKADTRRHAAKGAEVLADYKKEYEDKLKRRQAKAKEAGKRVKPSRTIRKQKKRKLEAARKKKAKAKLKFMPWRNKPGKEQSSEVKKAKPAVRRSEKTKKGSGIFGKVKRWLGGTGKTG